jgi:hypothetical protein
MMLPMVFQDVMPWGLVARYHFRGTCCLHFQGSSSEMVVPTYKSMWCYNPKTKTDIITGAGTLTLTLTIQAIQCCTHNLMLFYIKTVSCSFTELLPCLFQSQHDWLIEHVNGVGLHLWTVATNTHIVHPQGDMWTWENHGEMMMPAE